MDDAAPRDAAKPPSESTLATTPPPPPSPRKRARWPFLVASLLLVPLLLAVAWTAITLTYAYSRGERAGFIQKFSQKGWVCKTWEGELAMVNMPGAAQERFAFSVRSDSVAKQITSLMGSRVSLTYEQHRGVPTRCFGETDYYVTAVHPVP